VSQFDDLYREIILDHYKEPRNKGHIEKPDIAARGHNPLCGDEVDITMSVDDGRVADIRFDGTGCAISQASASMLTELIEGKSLSEVERIAGLFKEMMLEDGDSVEELGDLEALQGVKKYPVRIKCAILSWNTMLEGMEIFQKSRLGSG
jgi:nitrogen fixation NifU-like protein